jgi:Ni/Fe-hydrogenase subunit HybB-like protein
VCAGYAWELGLPWNFWHPIVMWNRASVLFEVVWCIMLYTTVLALEFSPALIEKLPWQNARDTLLRWQHRIVIALVMVGVLLSSMHQSFLGGLFIIFKGKEYPLWYSNYQTTIFYLSAIPAGMAMVIIALYLSIRSLNVKLDPKLLGELSQIITPMLVILRPIPVPRSPRAEGGSLHVYGTPRDILFLAGERALHHCAIGHVQHKASKV